MGEIIMKWIRLWCERLTSPHSGTWLELGESWELYTKLMCIAGTCEQHGVIAVPGTDLGYSDGQLAAMCRMPQDRFDSQLKHLLSLPDKVKRLPADRLEMLGWTDFQTPYDRAVEKGYRDKLQPKVTAKGYATDDKKIRSQKSEGQKTDEELGLGATGQEPAAPAPLRKSRKFTEEERTAVRAWVKLFADCRKEAVGSFPTGYEPDSTRWPEPKIANAALWFHNNGGLNNGTREKLVAVLRGEFYATPPANLAEFRVMYDRLIDTNRKGAKGPADSKEAELTRRAKACANSFDGAGCNGSGKGEACDYCPKTKRGSKR